MFPRPDAAAVLRDKRARSSLARYFDVMEDDKTAKFILAKQFPANFNSEATTSELWKIHDQLLGEFYQHQEKVDNHLSPIEKMKTPSQSFLDLKIEIANRILQNCHFCVRRCGANRTIGEVGFCRCGSELKVSTMFEHMGEEPELVPSGTIFTLGCTMRCFHCQNWTISQWIETGESYPPRRLARVVEQLCEKGCRNVNLVGGDPTPWLAEWLKTFKEVRTNIPVVWNSNSYYSEETAKLLAGFIDIYLLDFKYGDNKCSKRISDAPKYWETSTTNHKNGEKYGELIIRVLVLPAHLDCCTQRILRWISKELGPDTRTNVMFQYRPEWKAHEIPELERRLTRIEKEKAIQLAKKAGLQNFIT